MAFTITIPSPKDITTSVKDRARKVATTAELHVLAGVKRVSYAISDKAESINEKIDDQANKILVTK